ncbi:AlpA family transcriptional regulator [Mangrovicoccus sp. HB161399]|uniref:helix-turn-helix transcriptional regulator n=1 Tax=Mangrovicoccus sp. HB161399 TaxID=2720392 RepID=UPI001556CD61|nr:helix-turn-helix domain-containing protein [Mangrovicoccus sp. HB161399]
MNGVILITPDELRSLIGAAVRDAMQATTAPEAWLPVPTVATRLGKSEKTIRNWIRDGRFTRFSGGDGCPYLISSREVDALSSSASSAPDAS